VKLLFGLLTLAAVAAAPAAATGDLAAIKQRGELRIGADPTAGEPYFWQVNKQSKGFEAELGVAIARKLGLKATFVSTPWRELLPALKEGKIDLALNALEVRQDAEAQFSKPYYVSSQAILIRGDQQRIYGLSDLAGRRVATTDGSVAAAILAKLKPPAQTRLFADTQAPFQDLGAGKSEAVLLESAMVRRFAKADPKRFKLAGLPLLPRPYGAAMRKGNPQLVKAINDALTALSKAGDLHRILLRYNLWDSLQPTANPAPKPSATPAATRRHGRRTRRTHTTQKAGTQHGK
jgi:ABC-type amino acid transport substrate-binding protein